MASSRLDYGTLLEWERAAGAQAEDATETSTVRTFGSDEGYQIDNVWIYPPFDALGNLEELTVQLVIDGDTFDLVHIHSDTAPPYLENSKWIALPLGNRKSNNPVLNTCLKGNKKIQIKTIGGKGGVTGAYTIKLLGDYFKGDAAVQKRFGSMFNPTQATIFDARREGKSVSIYRPVPATIANLSNMSGGAPKADKPRVLPYITFAYNAAATTANAPFAYALEEQHVDKDWQDMRWDLGTDEAIYISNIGVKEVLHSKELWIQIADEEYPKGDSTNAPHFDIGYYTNELPFSNFNSEQPPRKYNILITNEKADIRIKDDGTSISADELLVGIWGKKFELR